MTDFSDRYQLVDRLAYQLGDREKAIKILQSRGHLMPDGKTLTPSGHARNMMTAEERAIDRGARKLSTDPSRLIYNKNNNRVYVRKK
jgi:hypothetical protein